MFGLGGGAEAGRDHLEAVFVDLALQQLQALLVSGLIGIHFRRPVQAFSGFLKITHTAVKIKELEQCLGIVTFLIGGIKQLTQEFQDFRRSTVSGRNFLHLGDEGAPLASPALELFQFAGERDRFSVQLRVDHRADQIKNLLDADRMLLKQVPHDGFSIHQPVGRQQGGGVSVAHVLRSTSGLHDRLENKDGSSHLSLSNQALPVGQNDGGIGGIFCISTLIPLCGIRAFGSTQFRDPGKSSCRALVISHFRAQLAQAQQVLVGRVQLNDAFENGERLRLASLLRQLGKGRLVGLQRQLFIGRFD